MSNFHVGQKVVCVDATTRGPGATRGFDPSEAPIEGSIYTVRRAFLNDDGVPVLWLAEIARDDLSKSTWGNPDLGYGAWRFRPVIERKTDISIFQRLLVPASKQKQVA